MKIANKVKNVCVCRRSREEIAILKEKKVQVMREEMRLKESLARIAEKTTGKDRRTLRTRTSHLDKVHSSQLIISQLNLHNCSN